MNKTRAIFWDVDGVLNTTSCWANPLVDGDYSVRLDPALVRRAAELSRLLDAQCVLSSTWRVAAGFARTLAALEKAGWTDARKWFIDWTPFASCARGLEIGAWLQKHPNVTEFVIIDDCDDMAGHSRRLVQTNPDRGLTDACCALARDMFSNQADVSQGAVL